MDEARVLIGVAIV